MYWTFALSSTPSLRWHGPLVQTAPQTSSISAGWAIRVYLSKLWAWDGVAIHPDDLPRILETFREALNSVKPFGVEGRLLRDRSGKVAKWYGTNTDIEEWKRAEVALRKSEEQWRTVSENSAIGVALTDYNGRFLATNHVFHAMVGYTEEELRSVNFLDLTHEDYRRVLPFSR
jgi:PAS domain-containing protein